MFIKNNQWMNSFETITGKTHMKIKMPNQDAVMSEVIDKDFLISAIADGHGSKKCTRSHLGALYAVESAIEVAKNIKEDFIKDDVIHTKSIGKYYTKRVIALWRKKIDDHLEREPLELDLLEDLTLKEIKSIKKNPYVSYGSTLLVVMLIKDYILCYQLGDGDILFVSKSNSVTKPIKRDDRHIANDTSSLCLSRPEKEFKIKVFRDLNHILQMILLSTDGYSNSFSSEAGFFKVGSDLVEMISEDGFNVIDENLKEWIEETSNNGSGDDTSVSILTRIDKKDELETASS
ncbi:MAG: protein phosphatase 2C domain-containing protein [Clostridiales bacterium]|nr:protein phosphatase 2C domain-containing protein [Clostridiales bacterium]